MIVYHLTLVILAINLFIFLAIL